MKKGWERKKLGEVCAFDKAQGIHRGLPYVGLEHIESHSARFIGSTAPQSVRSSTFRFSHEHVLYGRLRPYLNKALAPDFEGHCSTEIFPLKPCRELSREYLLYWLLSDATCECINATCTGARMPRAQMNEVLAFDFPLPPLAEQRRIVGILDEAFAGLATAQAHAEKNLQNARALFESHLNNVFSKKGEGWVEKPLTNLCEFFGDGDWVESKDQSSEGIRLVQTGNVGEGVFKDRAEKARYISEATFKRLRCTEIFEGDCLISRLPDPVGRSCILPNIGERMITAVDCTIVRFKRAQLFPKLFNLYSQSTGYIGAVAKQCTGTTRSRISRTNLGLIPVPVPPLPEQTRIIAHLDALSAETRRLAALYESKLSALAELKKSLLHRAFAGEL
jgi:type I restriction enzyme, S subunit